MVFQQICRSYGTKAVFVCLYSTHISFLTELCNAFIYFASKRLNRYLPRRGDRMFCFEMKTRDFEKKDSLVCYASFSVTPSGVVPLWYFPGASPLAISIQPFGPVVGWPFKVALFACADSRKAEALPYVEKKSPNA